MEIWQISIMIIALAVVVLVGFLIPVIIQLRRSIHTMEKVSKKLDTQLPPIMQNVNQITTNLSAIMNSGRQQVDTLGGAVQEIKGMVDDVVSVERKIKRTLDSRVVRSLVTITAGAKAAQAFIKAMRNHRPQKYSRHP